MTRNNKVDLITLRGKTLLARVKSKVPMPWCFTNEEKAIVKAKELEKLGYSIVIEPYKKLIKKEAVINKYQDVFVIVII